MPTSAELARRWFRNVWRPEGEAEVFALMAENIHGQMEGAQVNGRQAFLVERTRLLTRFPDLAVAVDDVVEQGDKVVVRWRAAATHTGTGAGFEPTGRRVSFRGMTWLEFQNGMIVRGWDSWNLGGLLQQLAE